MSLGGSVMRRSGLFMAAIGIVLLWSSCTSKGPATSVAAQECTPSGKTLVAHFVPSATRQQISDLGGSVSGADIRAYSRGSADYAAHTLRYELCRDAPGAELNELRGVLQDSGLIERLDEEG